MSEASSGPAEIPPSIPVRSYEDAEQEVDALWQAQGTVMREANVLFDAMPPEKQAIYNQAESHYREQCAAASEDGATLNFAGYLRTQLGEEDSLSQKMLEVSRYDEQIAAAEAARESFAPVKTEVLLRQAAALETTVDYDALVALGRGGENKRDALQQASFVIGTRQLLSSGPAVGYDLLLTLDRGLRSVRQSWEAEGLLKHRDAPEPQTKAGGIEDAVLLKWQSRRALNVLAEYHRDTRSIINLAVAIDEAFDQISKLEDLEDTAPVTIDELLRGASMYTTEELRAAMSRRGTARARGSGRLSLEADLEADGYQQYAAEARAIDMNPVLERLEISGGFANLPFEMTREELLGYIATHVPPIAARQVTKLTFRELTPEENPKGETIARNIIDFTTGEAEIIVHLPGLAKSYREMEGYAKAGQPVNPELEVKAYLKEILAHEYAHSFHDALPYAALQYWHQTVLHDPTRITEYVQNVHAEHHVNRYREDFADAANLFTNEASILHAVSNPRLIAMRRLYRDFMPGYDEVMRREQTAKLLELKALISDGSISYKDYRGIFLRHVV